MLSANAVTPDKWVDVSGKPKVSNALIVREPSGLTIIGLHPIARVNVP